MDPTNIIATQGSTILLIPLLVQWMKRSDLAIFRWISSETDTINRGVSWALGIVAALGIHWATDLSGGIFTFSLDFTQFSMSGLFHEGAVVGGQLGGQQVVYPILPIRQTP